MRWPWDETNHLSVSQNVSVALAMAMGGTASMVPVIPMSMSTLAASETEAGSSSTDVA